MHRQSSEHTQNSKIFQGKREQSEEEGELIFSGSSEQDQAGLSFLGIGAQVPTPSWGNMIKEHYAYITTDYAYLAILPGVCIMILVLAFMLLGNALRDALDVKS